MCATHSDFYCRTFERALDRHATHPVLAPTYNPTLFSRTPSLSADIAYLLETPESSWQSHPIHETLVSSPPEPFADYTARLQELADDESQVPRLLAHAYVRYLGDLSGGQFIKRRLVKAYGLEDGAGVSFYEFKQLGGSGSSTMGDMKKIKEWYRAGMNAGVGDDVALKGVHLSVLLIHRETGVDCHLQLRFSMKPTLRSNSTAASSQRSNHPANHRCHPLPCPTSCSESLSHLQLIVLLPRNSHQSQLSPRSSMKLHLRKARSLWQASSPLSLHCVCHTLFSSLVGSLVIKGTGSSRPSFTGSLTCSRLLHNDAENNEAPLVLMLVLGVQLSDQLDAAHHS